MGSRSTTAALGAAAAVVLGMMLAFGAVTLSPSTAQAQRVTELNYYGGHCRVCGDTYACSNGHGSWSGGSRSFRDPLPGNTVATRILMQARGVMRCSGNGQWDNYLNGRNWGRTYTSGGNCSCNGCQYAPTKDTGTHSTLPNYNEGGTNYYQMVWRGGLSCIARVRMTIYYRTNSRTCWRDYDGDGYGDPRVTSRRTACNGGWVTNSSDCNDRDRNIRPGAPERCNNVDDDCDRQIDEGIKRYYYYDYDGDSYGTTSRQYRCNTNGYYRASRSGDCNDRNGAIYPGRREVCNNIDDDCDGTKDEGAGGRWWYYDYDNDNYGTTTRIYQCGRTGHYTATRSGDCNDRNGAVYPGRSEICGNGIDDNCAGGVDENMGTYYEDRDRDGWGNQNRPRRACSQPGGYVTRRHDCDDGRNNVYPGRSESCDGLDNDCDGSVDEGVKVWRYRDADGDGYGAARTLVCPNQSGYSSRGGDCDDRYSNVRPGHAEICADGRDNNCNGQVDENTSTFYRDADGDGYGVTNQTRRACTSPVPSGWARNSGDCNDSNRAINPGATEICNFVDDNCDGLNDQVGAGRTYTFNAYVLSGVDYNSRAGYWQYTNQYQGLVYTDYNHDITSWYGFNISAIPDTEEIEYIQLKATAFYTYSSPAVRVYRSNTNRFYSNTPWSSLPRTRAVSGRYTSLRNGSRNTFNLTVGAFDWRTELADNYITLGLDEDYNSGTRYHWFAGPTYGTTSYRPQLVIRTKARSLRTTLYVDSDRDGFGRNSTILSCRGRAGTSTNNRDCNDNNAQVNPNRPEICGNRIDDNCDGRVDESTRTYYRDADGDGYGNPNSRTLTCATQPPNGYVTNNTDCNDNNRNINPNRSEICNQVDDNCRNGVDEGLTTRRYYLDNDNDTYGQNSYRTVCGPQGNYRATRNGDCNDSTAAISPARAEVCANNIDDNCNGQTDENTSTFYQDRDGDTYGNSSASVRRCTNQRPGGYVLRGGDCLDTNAAVHPGATEVCNGLDDDCNGKVDMVGDGRTYTLYPTVQSGVDYTSHSGHWQYTNQSRFYAYTNQPYYDISTWLSFNLSSIPNDAEVESITLSMTPETVYNNPAVVVYTNSVNAFSSSTPYSSLPRSRRVSGVNTGWSNGRRKTITLTASAFNWPQELSDNYLSLGVDEYYNNAYRYSWFYGTSDSRRPSLVIRTRGRDLRVTKYVDADRDGYGINTTALVCANAPGYATNNTDCNDGNRDVNPGHAEVCANNIDDNCNGQTDENTSTFYRDADGDTYGLTNVVRRACSNARPGGFAARGGDCDDTRSGVNPGATEICNFLDDNCDGRIDIVGGGSGTYTVTPYVHSSTDYNPSSGYWQSGEQHEFWTYTHPVYDITTWLGFNLSSVPDNLEVTSATLRLHTNAHHNYNSPVIQLFRSDRNAFASNYNYSYFGAKNRPVSSRISGWATNRPRTVPLNVNALNWSGDLADNYMTIGVDEVRGGNDHKYLRFYGRTHSQRPVLTISGTTGRSLRVTQYVDSDGDGFGSNQTVTSCQGRPGTSSNNRDCNDNNPNINPDAAEICGNGIDDNCAGGVDENKVTWYRDADGDSYGNNGVRLQACANGNPSGYVRNNTDCNDGNGAIRPGATEVCNGVDDNCNNATDEGLLVARYRDGDSDGFGRPNQTYNVCPGTNGYVTNNRDCNDSVRAINPNATEVCGNNVDDNCNGQIDETGRTYYYDGDGDGYGNRARSISACTAPARYVTNNTDCDDGRNNVHPGHAEVCDGLDNNCNGSRDEGLNTRRYYYDADDDTYGLSNNSIVRCGPQGHYTATRGNDCDDTTNEVNPGRAEICGNNRDDNCVNGVDENKNRYFRDADNDNYGNPNSPTLACTRPNGYVSDNTDCDDTRNVVNPGRSEVCDGLDNDCAGGVDNGLNLNTYYQDVDDDTYGTSQSIRRCGPTGHFTANRAGDCNDNTGAVNPGRAEICGNNIDDNCVNGIDENKNTYFRDSDSDGFGDTNNRTQACTLPNGYVANNRDCNDGNGAIHPNAQEVCDGIDNNCAGGADEGLDTSRFYFDQDDDNYGLSNNSIVRCGPTGHYTASVGNDCNDESANVNPGHAEVCGNNIDDNCNGERDENKIRFYEDSDNDRYGNPNSSQLACTAPNGYVTNNTDCDDGRGNVYPGNDEVCDGLDNDCAGGVDNGLATRLYHLDADNDTYGTSATIDRCGPLGNYRALRAGDCNDNANAINPDAAEVCGDEVDNNCNDEVDENKLRFYADRDNDSFGDPNNPTDACTRPNGYVTDRTDCDDSTDRRRPNLAEVCDGIDNDCVDGVDNGLATSRYYSDVDDDTYGVTNRFIDRCGPEGDYTANRGGDCNDEVGAINPGATEICGNNIDDNCADGVDENKVRYYRDEDEDTFGDPNNSTLACTTPSGYVTDNRDCDDTTNRRRPNLSEVCDDLDNDCNNQVDDGLERSRYFHDQDDDTYGLSDSFIDRCGPRGHFTANRGGDCRDDLEAVNPAQAEICGNGLDDNCADGVDENILAWYRDADQDDHGDPNNRQNACTQPDGYVSDRTDCNDGEARVFPGNEEVCDDLDNDCANGVDDGLARRVYYLDADNDTYGTDSNINRCGPRGNFRANRAGDCNDESSAVNPGQEEICGNGVDDNCADGIDENIITWYRDRDEDDHGNANDPARACTQPQGFVRDNTDCNDGEATVFPGNDEVCDGLDNDCNGAVDNGLNTRDYFYDEDADDYGLTSRKINRCGPDGLFRALQGGDCADTNDAVNPGVEEICGNDIDDNCNQEVDENAIAFYRDGDDDNYGDPNTRIRRCEQPDGFVTDSTDCDDRRDFVNPGADEVCDTFDNDCDGTVDNDLLVRRFRDTDEDGYGTSEAQVCPGTRFYASSNGDCNDGNAEINPGAEEVCDNVDNNCSGETDEGLLVTLFRDDDGDSYGVSVHNTEVAAAERTLSGEHNTTWALDATDNARGDVRVSFTASGDLTGNTRFFDVFVDGTQVGSVYKGSNGGADGVTISAAFWNASAEDSTVNLELRGSDALDGNIVVSGAVNYASEASGILVCPGRDGFVERDGDCDDSTAIVAPGANEICDFRDNNCEGRIDEGPRGGSVCGSADPVLEQLADISVETDQCGGRTVDLPTPVVSDDNDPNPTVSNDAPDTFPVGRTTVRWQAVDSDQNVGTMGHIVSVDFTGTPDLTPPNDVTMEADNPAGTVVNLGTAQASICIPGVPVVSNDGPDRYAVGSHTVTWTAAHPNANSATATQRVTITDTTPPTVNAGRDRVFVDPAPIEVAAPAVSDNGTPNREIRCSNDAPDTFTENRWTTVTWTCRDNNDNSNSDTVRIYRQVGDTPPPTITRESPLRAGWQTEAFPYHVIIDDPSCTDEPSVLFQGAGLSPTLTRSSENQWVFSTENIPAGGYSTSLVVTSACGQGLSTSDSIAFGYDPTGASLVYVGPSQRGVDPDDVNTWPATANRGVLSTLVRAQDADSGVVNLRTTIESLGGDPIELASYDADLLLTLPERGARLITVNQCRNEDHCTHDEKLRLETLIGTSFVLRMTATDRAGNVSSKVTYFRVFDFRSSVEAWRDAMLIARSDVQGAQDALNNAVAYLSTALDSYDAELYGNMLLALEDAVAKINVARAHDERVSDFSSQVLLTAGLAIDFYNGLYSQSRAENVDDDNHGIYNEAERRVAEARQAHDQNDAGAVYLALANVWFFTSDAEAPYRAENSEQARLLMINMIPDVGLYLDLDGNIPGQESLVSAYETFQNAEAYFTQIVLNGDNSLSDIEHLNFLLDMTAVAEDLKASENDGAWVRNWQWGVTHVTYLMARRALHNAGTWLGQSHPVLVLGNQQLEAARVLREQNRPDDFMRIVIDSRCLTMGLYNLVYDPDVEVIEACCEPMRQYHELDNNVPVPDHCVE